MDQPVTAWTFDLDNMTSALRQRFGERVRFNEPLARHGTFGVGGPADAWLAVEREGDLIDLFTMAAKERWPLMLVGNGTNLLYTDAGVRGIVVQNALATWELTDLGDGTAQLVGGAGVSLPKLVNDLAAKGWAGLEWGAGVPGSLGGAVISNAGAHGASSAIRCSRCAFWMRATWKPAQSSTIITWLNSRWRTAIVAFGRAAGWSSIARADRCRRRAG